MTLICMLMLSTLTGCGSTNYSFPYDAEYDVSSYRLVRTVNASRSEAFANELCIVTKDITDDENVDTSKSVSALLCDVNNEEVLYAKNAHERLHPASLTKVMTALVAIKYGSMDQMLTASDAVKITESGAQLCGIKEGDSMTLSQALHVLLINSANDAGMLIAEGVGGNIDNFVAMMNEEAKAIGATNTHFANPHGLTQEEHYTTAYDLYLIFNEAIKYESFREIIHMSEYETVYHDRSGAEKNLSVKNSNLYLRGSAEAPANITVVGGKTGTTNAAGHCLILLSRDTAGAPYISVILCCEERDALYQEMSDLLTEISK